MVAVDAVAALIRVAFAAQSVVTDPLPSALLVTEADLAAHLEIGAGAVAEAADRLVGAALWAELDGGLHLSRLAVLRPARPLHCEGIGCGGGISGALDGPAAACI